MDVSQRPDLLARRSGMSTNVLSRLNSWLDQGRGDARATIQFRGADGEVLNLRLEEE